MNTLREAVIDYVGMRRALGFKLKNSGARLLDFVSFLEERGASCITIKLASEWAQQPHSSRSYSSERICWVRGFAKYRSATDPRTEIPPEGLLSFPKGRAHPYFYTAEEIERLLKAAQNLQGRYSIKGRTYCCLFGLLAVSGMRIGEVLNLKVRDVDLIAGVLTVEDSKLGKSRAIPLHTSTQQALSEYKIWRDRFLADRPAEFFFVSKVGKRIQSSVVHQVFDELRRKIGLDKVDSKTAPRIHDMRHRFAYETLVRWYRNGEDVERKLPLLSTYLGHANVECTYWYLTACPELMGLAVGRLEQRWEESP